MRTVATVTIGQSPRHDIVPDLVRFGPSARWLEAGALDDLDDERIAALGPGPGEFPLVTRLRDGRSVVVGERAVAPLVQRAVERVEREADLVVLLCTGEFALACGKPLLAPGPLLTSTVAAIHVGRPIAVLTPHAGQVDAQVGRWRARGTMPRVIFASPYAETDFSAAGRRAREAGASLVVMDCLGYTLAMKAAVAAASGLPVLLPRSLVARVAAELLDA